MTVIASSTRSPDLVRLDVAWSGHRWELVLPARVAVGELVPALAAAIEALDPEEVHRGCALVRGDGRVLNLETGLRQQGVSDGETVTLVLGLGEAGDTDDVVHDDLADAVADALLVVSPAWGDDDSRTSSLVLCGLGLAGGALALGWHHSSGSAVGAAAAGLSVILLAAGAGAARRQAAEIANLPLLAAGPYAAIAGLAFAPVDPARSWLGAGLALALAGGATALVVTALPARVEPTPRPPLANPVAHPSPDPATPRTEPADPRPAIADRATARMLPTLALPWLVAGSFVALVGATAHITSMSMQQVVAVELVGLIVLAVVVLRLVAPQSRRGQRVALAGVLGVDLVMAAAAPVVVTGGGWAGLGLVGVGGLLLARLTTSVIADVGGSLLTGVAVGAALTGPALASVTALCQPPSLLLSLFPAVSLPSPLLRPGAEGALPAGATVVALAVGISVLTALAMAAPILTFLTAGHRSPSRTDLFGRLQTRDQVDLLVEVVAVVLLVILLVAAVGLLPPVGQR